MEFKNVRNLDELIRVAEAPVYYQWQYITGEYEDRRDVKSDSYFKSVAGAYNNVSG
jgi:hypothetical protein